MARRKYFLFFFVFLSTIFFRQAQTTNAQVGANRLAALAAGLQPRSFALLDEEGDGSGYDRFLIDARTPAGLGVGSIYAYAQKAAYDPANDRVYFSGGAHDGQTETIRYDIATNTWTNLGLISGRYGHSYDTNAINTSTGELYASSTLEPNTLRRLDLASGTWSSMAQPSSLGFSAAEASMEYFPDRNELLWLQYNRLAKYDRSADRWTTIGNLPALAFRSPIARYSNACHCVLIIGGADTDKNPAVFSHAVYKYDANGTITRLKDSPPSIKIYISRSVVAADPVSGEFVFLQAVLGPGIDSFTGQYELWSYDINADAWTQQNASSVPAPSGWWDQSYPFAVVAAPISRYGVIMFMSGNPSGNKSKVYIYKHAPGGGTPFVPDTVQPTTPTNVTAVGVTQNQIDLSWSTSSDNVGVAGYKVLSGGVVIGVVSGTSFQSTGLAPGTSYSYSVVAYDAAGNTSVESVLVVGTTTGSATTPPSTTPPPSTPPPTNSATSSTFSSKCGSSGVIGCFGFDSLSDVRTFPVGSPFPIRYLWFAGSPCDAAGLGTNHVFTINRNAGEGNAFAKPQAGTCYFPTIDSSVYSSGGGALRIEVPSNADSTNGGYFDSTFRGHDMPTARIGPDNGGEVWHQFQYMTHNLATNNLNGAFKDLAKSIIFGNAPPGLDFFGSDITMASVFGYNKNHDGIWESYTRLANSNFATHERNIGGTLYMQTGSGCVYAGQGPYPVPPCMKDVDDSWQEVTRHFKLRPVAPDFTVLGTALSRPNTFSAGMVGRYVYIVGDGYFRITAFLDSSTVVLGGIPSPGGNKTVFISNSPNSIIQQWVNGQLVTDISDAQFAWDLVDPGWGQFRLQPHMTNKDASVAHSPGTVWYDDFIVSTQPIPMTGGTLVPSGPNPTPSPAPAPGGPIAAPAPGGSTTPSPAPAPGGGDGGSSTPVPAPTPVPPTSGDGAPAPTPAPTPAPGPIDDDPIRNGLPPVPTSPPTTQPRIDDDGPRRGELFMPAFPAPVDGGVQLATIDASTTGSTSSELV